MSQLHLIKKELAEANQLLEAILENDALLTKIEASAELMKAAIQAGNKIISCGNGGSHCDAMHFAEELTGRYRENRKALPAICISDSSHISCTANDYGFDSVFSRFIEGLGNPEDILLAITTSGNSANVIQAAKAGKEKKMKIISLTGNDGGKIAPLSDISIIIPFHGYADRIQEIHIKIVHLFILLIEQKLKL